MCAGGSGDAFSTDAVDREAAVGELHRTLVDPAPCSVFVSLTVTQFRKIAHLFQFYMLTLKNNKWSYRCPFLVHPILLCSLGSIVFYRNMKCAFSSIFHGDLNIVK